MMALGRIYENGIGTKIDVVKAFYFYDQAAAKNEPYALFWLGKACEVSSGILIINKIYRLDYILNLVENLIWHWHLNFIRKLLSWILKMLLTSLATSINMGLK
jgi:hypothetical protein